MCFLFFGFPVNAWFWEASQGGAVVKNPPAMQEIQQMWVWCLGQEDPLEEEMPTHSSILAWKILWTEEPSSLKPVGLQRVRHNLETTQQQQSKIRQDNSNKRWQRIAYLERKLNMHRGEHWSDFNLWSKNRKKFRSSTVLYLDVVPKWIGTGRLIYKAINKIIKAEPRLGCIAVWKIP